MSEKPERSDPFVSLRNQFLVSMPGLVDSIFARSVTYICDHSPQGAMGIIINHPLGITLDEVFQQLLLEPSEDHHSPVLAGGPVNTQQGLVLHRKEGSWQSTMEITSEICITASKDIIEAMASGKGPKHAQLVLGYAGWSEGQLEEELGNNCWLTLPADERIIFEVPTEDRWNAVAEGLGIDLNLISNQLGHA